VGKVGKHLLKALHELKWIPKLRSVLKHRVCATAYNLGALRGDDPSAPSRHRRLLGGKRKPAPVADGSPELRIRSSTSAYAPGAHQDAGRHFQPHVPQANCISATSHEPPCKPTGHDSITQSQERRESDGRRKVGGKSGKTQQKCCTRESNSRHSQNYTSGKAVGL
jgi:hypothetical protein